MGTIVDSSVLIASLHEGDSQHAKAVAALRVAERPLIIHEHIALETATVFMRQAGKAVADSFIRAVLSFKDFALLPSTDGLFVSSANEFLASKNKLSPVDCVLLCLSSYYTILTFDEVLQKAIKRHK